MSKKKYDDLVIENFDADSEEITPEQLAEKGVTITGFGLSPKQAVYIPTLDEGRKSRLRAGRKGGEKNIPVITCVKMELKDGKYHKTDVGIEVGVSSLFNLDYTNKPHQNDETSAKAVNCSDHLARVETIAGMAILAADKEDVIKVQRTQNGTKADGSRTVTRLYADDGSPLLRDKRIVTSRILGDNEWVR